MWSADVEARWRALSEEVITGMAEWRGQHPRATLKEIEAALDERLAHVRARMLQDTALASAATIHPFQLGSLVHAAKHFWTLRRMQHAGEDGVSAASRPCSAIMG